MIERVSGEPSGTEKKGKVSTPDTEAFKEMMKTGTVEEAEFEKGKKRRYQAAQEGEERILTPRKPPPATLPSAFAKEGITKELPEPTEARRPPPTEAEPEKFEKEGKVEKEEKPEEEKEKKELTEKEFKEFIAKEKKAQKKEKKEKLAVEKKEEKVLIEKEEKKEKKVELEKIKEEVSIEKEKEKKEIKPEISSVLQEMPPNIANQVQSLTQTISPYLHPDIIPIFEKMVGAIIQMQAKGITTTTLILNSPAFTSSIFYGSTIIISKYATAEALNVTLKGTAQAVNMFNENKADLLEAFARCEFKINRLDVEHERPLFRRKEKAGEEKEKGEK